MRDSTRQSHQRVTRRRNVLKALGTSATVGLAGLAGCTGSGSSGNSGAGTTTSNGGSTTNNNGGDTDSSEWPDLSGESLHFVSQESNPSAQEFFKNFAADFEKATGAKVKLEFTGRGTSGEERVIQLAQAGTPPEIYTPNTKQAVFWALQGVVETVNEPLQRGIDRVGGEPVDSARAVVDGDDYIVSFGANFGCHWYRSDIVNDVVPNTWDKVLEYAKKAESNSDMHGTYVPSGKGAHAGYHFIDWLYSNDGVITTRKQGDVAVAIDEGSNRSRVVETIDFLKECYQYSPEATDSSWSTMIQAIPNGTSAQGWYGGARPKVQAIKSGKSFAPDMHPLRMPSPKEDGPRRGEGSADGFVTFKGANTKVAHAFMDFFMQTNYMVALPFELSPVHVVSTWPTIVESSAWQDRIDQLDSAWSDEDISTYMEGVAQSYLDVLYETEPPNPYAGAIMGSGHISSMMQEVLINEKDPENMVDVYAEKIQATIDQASKNN